MTGPLEFGKGGWLFPGAPETIRALRRMTMNSMLPVRGTLWALALYDVAEEIRMPE